MAQLAWRKRMLPVLSLLLYSTSASAESSYIASCPNIHDSLTNPLPSTCPVAQDGYTYTSFPWTHNPPCVNVVLATDDDTSSTSQLFCTYTNAAFNNGRGISFVVSPEVAMSISFETFGMAVGGLDGEIGEAMGVWEVKETEEMGKGMFAKQDVAAVFGGESFVSKTPVVLVSKQFLDLASTAQGERMLRRAVEQLPEKTRGMLEELAKTRGGSDAVDVVLTNGIAVKWPWVDDMPVLLAVTPEVARINHACRPNALWRFSDSTLAFDVFALRNIKPGEEITLSYGFSTRAHSRRTRSIEANFGFSCLCPKCTANEIEIEASNDRLSEIKALKSVLPTDHADTPQLLRLLPPLIKLLEEEHLLTELPGYEEILAYTWSSFGIEDRAKYWAGRARKHWGIISGSESWEKKRCGDLEDNVKGHSTWMSWEGDPWEEKDGHDHDHDHEH